MGMNYYAVKNITAQDKQQVIEMINENRLEEAKDTLYELTHPIHIGKSSAGWMFLFAENPEYYEPNKESIKEFLDRGDFRLEDEEHVVFTSDELFEKVEYKQKDKAHPSIHGGYMSKDGYCFVGGCSDNWS